MAGVVRSDLASMKNIDFSEFEQNVSANQNDAQDLILDAKAIIEHGHAVRLNRSITDAYIENLLRDGRLFKDQFAKLNNLHLNFEAYATLTDEALIKVVKETPHLTKINLKSCVKITDKAVVAIAENCPDLQEIDLGFCDISEKSVFALAEHSKKLTRIGVRSCYVTDRSIEALVKAAKHLKDLSLAWCKSLTDEAMKAIATYCPQAELLDIRGNEKITAEGFIHVIRKAIKLKVLHLKRCINVNDAVLEVVAQNLPLLEKLNLRGCTRLGNITNQGLISVAENCSKLKSLDIAWHDYVSDEAMIAFAENCPHLGAMDLSGCAHLTVKTVEKLKELEKLGFVIFFNNPHLNEEDFEGLRNKGVRVKVY